MICNVLWQWCICICNEQLSRENLSIKPYLILLRAPIITKSHLGLRPTRVTNNLPEKHAFCSVLGVAQTIFMHTRLSVLMVLLHFHSPSVLHSSVLLCALEDWALQIHYPCPSRCGQAPEKRAEDRRRKMWVIYSLLPPCSSTSSLE